MTQPEPPPWIINVPSTPAVHDEPPPAYGWEGISDTALQGLRENLVEAIVGLIGQLPDIALNLIRQLITMIDGAEDMIFEIINMVLGWITQAPELIITVIETALAWLIEIPELFISVVNAIVGIITDIPEIIVTIIDALLEWITSIPDLILTVVDTFLSWISDDSDLIITVIEAGLQWLIDVPDMVTSIVEAFLEFITSIPDVTEAILNAFESWVDSFPEFITDLVGAFFGWITDVPGLVVGVVTRILEWFTDDNNLVETVVSTWLGFITEIPGLISLLITTWITWIIEAPGMALEFITSVLLPFGLFDEIPILKLIEQLLTGTYVVSPPLALPFTLPANLPEEEVPPLVQFFSNLLDFFNIGTWLSGSFNPIEAALDFIEGILKPTGLLAWLDPITGLLPDLLSPVWLVDLADNLINAVKSIPGGGIIGGIVGFWADFVKSLLGLGPTATPAYTPANAAVANLQTQVNYLLADNDPSTSGFFEGFNTPPTLNATWTNVFGPFDCIHSDGVLWHPTGYNCKRYNAARPGTTKWQVQGSIAYIGNRGGLAGRLLCGVDPTNWTSRYPAIEVLSGGGGNDNIRIVSLAGNPNSVANANIGRMVHAEQVYGPFIIKTGDVVAMEVDETAKIYRMYLNPGPGSTPILTYDDSTANLFTRGVGHRDVAAQFNVNNAADPFQGNGWDNISAFDRLE